MAKIFWALLKSDSFEVKNNVGTFGHIWKKIGFFFKKWTIPGLFFVYIRQRLQQINVKNVHPVYGAGIRTHTLQIESRIP